MHAHTWIIINSALRRYRCTDPQCGVVGHAPPNRRRVIVPYACKFEVGNRNAPSGRMHCGKPAVFAGHLATQHRCADHASVQPVSSAASA
jgi:hypothetical protein